MIILDSDWPEERNNKQACHCTVLGKLLTAGDVMGMQSYRHEPGLLFFNVRGKKKNLHEMNLCEFEYEAQSAAVSPARLKAWNKRAIFLTSTQPAVLSFPLTHTLSSFHGNLPSRLKYAVLGAYRDTEIN